VRELSDLANQDAAWSQSEFIFGAYRKRNFKAHASHASASTPAGVKPNAGDLAVDLIALLRRQMKA
jgi:hypothetical protein